MVRKSVHARQDSCNNAWVKGARTVIKLFLRLKTVGAENIDPASEPAVFVGNHGSTVGPIAAACYLPVRFRPWIHDRMLDRDKATESMLGTYKDRLNFLGEKRKRRLFHWMAGLVTGAMDAFNPISVCREKPLKMKDTLRESLDALEGGGNLLIFPERPYPDYNSTSFHHLSPTFGLLGSMYYEETGRCLAFYPCFTDKKRKRFVIGAPVYYTPAEDVRDLVVRVQDALIRISEP
jgi:hypothetical protein